MIVMALARVAIVISVRPLTERQQVHGQSWVQPGQFSCSVPSSAGAVPGAGVREETRKWEIHASPSVCEHLSRVFG